MLRYFAISICIACNPLWADAVVPVKTVRPNIVLTHEDVVIAPDLPGHGLSRVEDVIGKEARVVLYAGRPIRPDDISEPAIITRNQIVSMTFFRNGLQITTTGRSLDRGAIGETIKVMNVSSKNVLFGTVTANGDVIVSE